MTPIESLDYVIFSNSYVNDHLSLSHFEMLIKHKDKADDCNYSDKGLGKALDRRRYEGF